MEELKKALTKLVLEFCELLYRLREFIVILLLGIGLVYRSPSREDAVIAALFCLMLVWVCLVLRQWHREYKIYKRNEKKNKRFTFVDNNGNPNIRIEDLPEIVEYLFRIEEEMK